MGSTPSCLLSGGRAGAVVVRPLASLREEVGQGVDFLLIDTGAGISDTVLNLIVASDEALVVTRPEPTALTDAYALMKVIVQHRPAYPFHLLINLVKDAAQAQQIYDSHAQILMKFLGYQPGYAGHVVTDPIVGQAVIKQVPFTILAPRAPATRDLEALTRRLLGTAVHREGDAASFCKRLMTWSWGQA